MSSDTANNYWRYVNWHWVIRFLSFAEPAHSYFACSCRRASYLRIKSCFIQYIFFQVTIFCVLYPNPCNVWRILIYTDGSSIVGGILTGFPEAKSDIVFRAVFPDLVLGRPFTHTTWRNAQTAPMSFRTFAIISLLTVSTSGFLFLCFFRTYNPRGIWPFTSSGTPTTAASATSLWPRRTSSRADVENL